MKSITELTQEMDSIKAEKRKLMRKASQVLRDLIFLRVSDGKVDQKTVNRDIDNMLTGFSAEEKVEILKQMSFELVNKSNSNKESEKIRKEAASIFTGRRMR